MRTTFLPCLPTRGTSVPATPAWLHEVKYDGYPLIVQREGNAVRLFSRNGNDWSGRYPWIVEAALKNKHSQFVIDGEAVVLGVDGGADFNALHSRKHNHKVQLYAFDILALDGDDLRGLPLSLRKANLARRPDGIFVAPFAAGEIGPDLFRVTAATSPWPRSRRPSTTTSRCRIDPLHLAARRRTTCLRSAVTER